MDSGAKKAVLITGANGGIGKALCTAFTREGYYVIATDFVEGDAACDAFMKIDLSELVADSSLADVFMEDISKCLSGRSLCSLINNAAFQQLASIENFELNDFRKTLDINLVAPMLLSKLLFPHLKASKGSIVNIGSIHANLTKPEFIYYATSKAALRGLTHALAVDMGGSVRVNIVQPAATRTEMLVAGFLDKEDLNKLESFHPIKRIAEPEEICSVVLFLASDNSSFVTGSSIDVDGGIGHRLHDPV